MKGDFWCWTRVVSGTLLAAGWLTWTSFAPAGDSNGDVKAFIGARVIDGTGKPAIEKATLLVRNGRIQAVGASVRVPSGAQRIGASGKTIIPGLITAHSHISQASDLGVYVHYGVTTVFSLGGDKEIEIRDQARAEQQTPGLRHSRLFIAGPVVTAKTPEEARQAVDALAAAKTDIVKFRLDDNLGAGSQMPPEVYAAIFEEARSKGMRVAVHAVYLSDVKAVSRLGAKLIAHSVRDYDIDDETIALIKKNNAFYCPTLMREISTFAYPDKPEFLSDPLLLKWADPRQVARVQDAAFIERVRNDRGAQWYKEHMPVAMRNLKKVSDAGVQVVMGTDSGPPGRFQGYFEHMELEYMVRAGLTPMQALVAATGTAARHTQASDQIGTLQPGRWADLLVLDANPLDDIRNTRKIDSVWIAGNRVPEN